MGADVGIAHGPLSALFHDAERPPVHDDELHWYATRLPRDGGKYSLNCAVIVKKVDAQTRKKVGINALLRDL